MAFRKHSITKDFLIEHYVNQGKSRQTIAKEFGCSYCVIDSRMKEFGIKSRPSKKVMDIVGSIVGHYEVLSRVPKDSSEIAGKNNNCKYYYCQCRCGVIDIIPTSALLRDKRSGVAMCRKCEIKAKRTGSNSKLFTGLGEISGSLWNHIKRNAKRRDVEISVDINYVWNLFLSQNRKCNLTGLDICIISSKKRSKETTASLDRIDSKKGYHDGNLQWVHKDVQKMKMDLNQDRLVYLCCKVAEYKVARLPAADN